MISVGRGEMKDSGPWSDERRRGTAGTQASPDANLKTPSMLVSLAREKKMILN